MKQFLLTFVLLFLAITTNLIAATDPVASIVFSSPAEENNISLFVNTNSGSEAYTESANKGNQDCLYIPTNKYAYFRVDDAIVSEYDNNLIIHITYFDEGYGSIAFQYNATNNTNYDRQSFKKTGSNTWITTTLSLTNASFRNAQNNSADFRITEDSFIRSISITKGALSPETETVPATSGSAYSEFKGKSVAGYQAWFTASDENSGWVHWSGNTRPEPGNSSFEVYPDVREYDAEALSPTGFANLGNGKPSEVFTSAEVIETHFKWMKETGIDGVALQRFIGDNPYPINNSILSKPIKVKEAAEKYEKIFYVCYDMSSGNDEDAWVESIKFDWVYNIEQSYALTSSPAYATVNNKPVVQIWGPGFTSRVGNSAKTIELIEFLKSRGCYVIGGVPTHWRKEEKDSKPNFLNAYKTYDMISPWTPGRYTGLTEVDNFKNDHLIPDKIFCDANGLDYMPVLFPGFAWSTWNNGTPNHIPREAGNFLWRQAYNIKTLGLDEMYFAMFDEYDEGTAIMKAATDWSMIPTDYYFLTLSADGIWVSSDFYLRVAGAATAMLKSSETPLGAVSVPHSKGPVYYRNSFEKRFTKWERNGVKGEGYQNLDPCFYKPELLDNNSVTMAVCEIVQNQANAKSGLHSIQSSGNPNSSVNASYDYKFAEVSIPVVENMRFIFWKKTVNELGKYVSLDLIFESGKRLSQLTAYNDNNGKGMHPGNGRGNVGLGYEQSFCEIGKGELLGDKITGIIASYSKAALSGSYTAYFDDILITTDSTSVVTTSVQLPSKKTNLLEAKPTIVYDILHIESANNTRISIFNIYGIKTLEFISSGNNSINASSWHPGVFFIVAKGCETIKVIKK